MQYVIYALLAMAIAVPAVIFYTGAKNARRFKLCLVGNIVSFFGVMLFAVGFMFSGYAFAAEAQTAAAVASDSARAMGFLSAGLVTGLATIGTGIATGQAASAALGALSENESIMGKALIFVSMCEGIAIYGILISFNILGRI